MTIDEIRKRFETPARIISAAHARGEHGPSMDMRAAANIEIAALLAAHDLQSARAYAAEAVCAALRARVAELDGRVQTLGEQGRMWRRRAENAEARAVEMESQRPGPAPVATEGMIEVACAAHWEHGRFERNPASCPWHDRAGTIYADKDRAEMKDAINAALRKGREEGVL